MSGHSQFANIKHRKDAQDSKRGKIFQRISREIYVAVKLNGPNVDNNPKLRTILEKARSLNMPKDNINRAIQKALNQNDNTNFEEVVYEGYGPGSIALIVHCLTDNKNRTASNIRSYFNKCQGKLGTTNSVQYLFSKAGVLEFVSERSLDDILELVLDYEILDLRKDDANLVHLEVSTKDIVAVSQALEQVGVQSLITNEVRNIPLDSVSASDLQDQDLNAYQKLYDLLDNDDDVQLVESNLKS